MENRRGHIRYIYYIYIYTCTGGKWREPIPFLVSWSKLVGRNGRNIRAGQKFGSVPTEMIRRGVNADPLSRPLSLSLSLDERPARDSTPRGNGKWWPGDCHRARCESCVAWKFVELTMNRGSFSRFFGVTAFVKNFKSWWIFFFFLSSKNFEP